MSGLQVIALVTVGEAMGITLFCLYVCNLLDYTLPFADYNVK